MSRPRAKITGNFPGCPVESTLSLLDGKWKGVILYHLMTDSILRFSELQRRLPSITQRMLTKQLRELEESGLVTRTVFPVVPPRVDYGLTATGKSLEPVIMALGAWGQTHVVCQDGQKFVAMPADADSPAAPARSAA